MFLFLLLRVGCGFVAKENTLFLLFLAICVLGFWVVGVHRACPSARSFFFRCRKSGKIFGWSCGIAANKKITSFNLIFSDLHFLFFGRGCSTVSPIGLEFLFSLPQKRQIFSGGLRLAACRKKKKRLISFIFRDLHKFCFGYFIILGVFILIINILA